jgi:GT2 family glycosyltransferase
MKSKNTTIIIVNYNGLKITQDCLKTLLKNRDNFLEIILVDNDSHDGSKEYFAALSKKHRFIKVIFNSKNNGFAEANNQGYEIAKGKYICFLNNDTLVPRDFLLPMVSKLEENDRLAAVQPLILFPDLTIDSVGSYMTPTGFLYHKAHRQKPNSLNSRSSKVYSLKGACMVWKKSVLDEIGVLDESYFAYFEETDVCHRAINAGYHLLFTAESQILHLGGYTSNKLNQEFIQYHNTKNRVLTFRKNMSLGDKIRILPLHLLLTEGLIVKSFLTNFKLGLAMQKGFMEGMRAKVVEQNQKLSLGSLIKEPDLGYYRGLFSSLKNYNKLW